MEGNPEPEQPRPRRVQRIVLAARTWLLASPRHVGYAVVVAALLLTIPFGGLAAVPEEEVPLVAAGEPVSAAPWELTLEKAVWGPDLGGFFTATEGRQHLLVLGTLRTTAGAEATVPTSELGGSVVVRAVDGSDLGLGDSFGNPLEDGAFAPLGDVYSLEPTPQQLDAVPPGLAYDVALALTATGEIPEEIEVELSSKTLRLSSLDDTMIWADPAPVARVRVPTERSGPVFENVWDVAP